MSEARRPSWLLVGLVVALIASLGWAAWATYQRAQESQVREAGQSAEDAARSMLEEMTTYRHDSVDEDFAWLEDYGTPEFRESYAKSAASIKEFVRRFDVDATGTVEEIAHRVDDENHAVVIAFVDQELVTKDDEGGTDQLRIRLTMSRDGDADDDWTVDDLTIFGGDNAAQGEEQ